MNEEKDIDPLYREFLLEHYKESKHKGVIKDPDIHKSDSNPLCGDEIEIFIKLGKDKKDKKKKNNTIKELSFQGRGCVISMACASILTDELQGKTIDEINKMDRDSMLDLLNIKLTPTRVKCAMLALNAIKKGIIEYESKK